MSKGIILYQSKYGATKKYADWLVEETGFDCVETKNAKVVNLQEYDVIILGGGVYASGIAGLQFLKKNIGQLADKKIVVFAVGASPSLRVLIEALSASSSIRRSDFVEHCSSGAILDRIHCSRFVKTLLFFLTTRRIGSLVLKLNPWLSAFLFLKSPFSKLVVYE